MPRGVWIATALSIVTALALWAVTRLVVADSPVLSFRGWVSVSDSRGRPIAVPLWILPLIMLFGVGALTILTLRRSR